MSKAFTRENDEAPERVVRSALPQLPPGAKNYVTARGLKSLRRELQELSSQPITPRIRLRIFEFQQTLLSAAVVETPPPPWTEVLFGSTVSIRNQQGEEISYTVVGVNETDVERNRISWLSPVALALLKKRVGEQVCIRTPAGEEEWQITKVDYEDRPGV